MNKRIAYLDYLRILASFAIVMIHAASGSFYNLTISSLEWQTLNFYNSISRWGVPVFIMISGALLLPKEISIKALYRKYIFRLTLIYIVWSFVYALFKYQNSKDVNDFINTLIFGEFHEWYLLMIIGLYITIPIVKKYLIKKHAYTSFSYCQYLVFLSRLF